MTVRLSIIAKTVLSKFSDHDKRRLNLLLNLWRLCPLDSWHQPSVLGCRTLIFWCCLIYTAGRSDTFPALLSTDSWNNFSKHKHTTAPLKIDFVCWQTTWEEFLLRQSSTWLRVLCGVIGGDHPVPLCQLDSVHRFFGFSIADYCTPKSGQVCLATHRNEQAMVLTSVQGIIRQLPLTYFNQ